MIRFRQKNYTIQEGHYTGPKDTSNLPGAVELIAKGGIAGTAIGAGVGALTGKKDLENIIEKSKYGLGAGAVAGLLAKLLVNYSQKPMSSLKYQEVDKAIRQRFGVFNIAGITVGDSIDKRDKIEDKFSFNDRDVASYKINIAICDDKLTMYTFGMTDSELNTTSNTLDYYCKKYYGIEYDSKVINKAVNSYSVTIIFNNVSTVCDFIVELSDKLKTKINFLDSKAIVLPRLKEKSDIDNLINDIEEKENHQKDFSVTDFGTFDVINLLTRGTYRAVFGGNRSVIETVTEAASKLSRNDLDKLGIPRNIGQLDNKFLEKTLKDLHYVEGFNYTVSGSGDGAAGKTNMSLNSGILFITSKKGSESDSLDTNFYNKLRTKIQRVENTKDKVIIYSYQVKNEKEFKDVLNALMSCNNIKFNLYDENLTSTGKFLRFRFGKK